MEEGLKVIVSKVVAISLGKTTKREQNIYTIQTPEHKQS